MTAVGDNVQKRLEAAFGGQSCTQAPPGQSPLFFIGSSPSMANRIISLDYSAAGVMISFNALESRISDFEVKDWVGDSGSFTKVARWGGYPHGVERHYSLILRWKVCGNPLGFVAEDWMCEPLVIKRTGLSVERHQELTLERYDALMHLVNAGKEKVRIIPVLQGYRNSDYIKHLTDYGERLAPGAWVGVGSICRRNGNPEVIADLLRGIKLIRPDLRLHGFGLKQLALENQEVRSLLYSCDSMAWRVPRKFGNPTPELELAHQYQQKIQAAATDSVPKRIPPTAGAGNGQGRKPQWNRPTKAIRVPAEFANCLIAIARQWDEAP